uniref:DDE_Tnp_IS1595 domain-containing protein n=1 Tax=Anopheles minimus TaxID=112268 RepID=A0A182W7W2_9DIPT
MKLKKVLTGDRCKWLCRRKACAGSCTIVTGSIFFGAESSLASLTLLRYEWSAKSSVSRAMVETGLDRSTVLDWYRLLRNFLFDYEFDRTSRQIGGTGMTVEVDETKVVRQKYHIGCVSASHKEWLRVETKTQGVLNDLILRHVAPGTRILSDCWAGYNGLSALGFQHETVNHSHNFVDPLQGDVHTQRIENVWRWLKHFLKQKGTNICGSLEGYFAEYMFRKKHEANVFEALVAVIARETC